MLSTVTKDGISQKVVERWADQVGEPIEPEPLDWPAWRAAKLGRPAPAPEQKVAGRIAPAMNRAQRGAAEKAAKRQRVRA